MGLHYANGILVADGTLDANRPEVLVYEPRRGGRMQLVAVEYLVIAEAWDANNAAPPVLQGQLFHYERSEGRRVGKGCVSKGRSRWSPYHSKKHNDENAQ